MAESQKAEEGYLNTNGFRTYYKKIFADKGQLPIMFLHGGPGSSHDYLLSLSALGSERPLVFYDQFGSGRSEGRGESSRWTLEAFVEQLASLVQQLELEQFHLYGHSWGGMLALEYMKTKPTNVQSLILASTMYDIPAYRKTTDELLLQISLGDQAIVRKHEREGRFSSREYQEVVSKWNRTYLWRGSRPERIDSFNGFNDDLYRVMWGPSEFSVTGSLRDWSATGWMGEIQQPTLVISGEFDEVTPGMSEHAAQLLPNAHYEVVEGGAHLVHVENPESYLTVLRDFLQTND